MKNLEEKINIGFRNGINAKIGNLLSRTGISPNTLTIVGIFASIMAAFIVIRYGLFVGAFFVLLSSLFDISDGAVAKATNKVTNLGGFLDDISDRIGEILYFSAIFLLESSFAVFLAAISSVLVSYFNASARAWGFKPCSGKVTGRPGRIILLIILMLISPWWPIFQTIWLIVLLNIFTLAKRGYEVKK